MIGAEPVESARYAPGTCTVVDPMLAGRVARADATLRRATAFLSGDRPPSCRSDASDAPPRVLGNALRELDRFLHILIDEVACAHGLPPRTEQRNTANKLEPLSHALPGSGRRLRALGRSRACLFYTGGVVRRADVPGGAWMTAGWPLAGELRRFALGQQLSPSAADLADVCRFYDRLGAELVRGLYESARPERLRFED